jgi:hypothetical protein
MANHLCRSWRIVESAGAAHRRSVNGILGFLCKEHFPGLVEYAGVVGLAYTFDQYAAACQCFTGCPPRGICNTLM